MTRAAFLAIAVSLSAGNAQPSRANDMLREWADAVIRHHAGERDNALESVGEWTYNDLELMQPLLEAFVGTPERNDDLRAAARRARLSGRDRAMVREAAKDKLGTNPDAFRRRAAMLHTDAAVLLDPPTVTEPPAERQPNPSWARGQTGRRVDVISLDAEYQRVEYVNPHWEIAMDMLDAIAAQDPFVAQWFGEIGTYLVVRQRFNDGLEHFDRARRIVPEAVGVLVAEARLHEALSAPLMQNFVRISAVARGVSVGGIDDRRTELRRAEALLQKALGGNPSLDHARLRLGRVIMQQDRWDEGLRHVEHVRAHATDEQLLYYANVFAGDAELALARAADAKTSFDRALTAYPESQAARLGLAAAIAIDGKREDALTALLPTLMASPERTGDDDPWWVYYGRSRDEALSALERVRAAFGSSRR